MQSAPRLYRPGPPLSDHVEFFGHWESDAATDYQSRALPRGAITIVFDVGPQQRLDFYAPLDVPDVPRGYFVEATKK
jgi:hypothetical protein